MSGNNGFMSFGFGNNDDGVGVKSDRFKAEGGRAYRVSFAHWPLNEDGSLNLDAPTPEFTGAPRIFIPGAGFIINPTDEIVKLQADEPKLAVGTVLVVWPTDDKGMLDKTRFAGDKPFRVQPWVFSQDKYRALVPVHSEWPFGSHDIVITCSDTKFQKMTFSSCKESLLRKILENPARQELADKLKTEIAAKVKALPGEIGRPMTLAQVREKLGGAPVQPQAGSAGSATSSTPVSSSGADIDDLINTMLTPPA